MLETFLLVLIVVSWAYLAVSWWWTRDFFRTRHGPDPKFAPPVSILKPVKGLDAEALENFASFCRQDYADYEILFGVSDPSDPVISVIQRLQRDWPERDIRLVIAPATRVNRKASLLQSLAAQARHNVFVVSDSDMRVTPDYLRRVVAPLADQRIGLVTCLYRGESARTFTAQLEALHMGATFVGNVLVARKLLSMRFAMGATAALRRGDLERLGGFAALADYLADDYQLGARIADLGLRVHLSDYVVSSILGPTTFREQWDREVRWAQCSRVSRPWEFPGLVLTFSTPLSVILALVTGLGIEARVVLVVSLAMRWLVGWSITGYIGNRSVRRWLLWLPVRDMLSALVWVAGTLSRRVVWRGEEYVLQGDGRLQPVQSLTFSAGEGHLTHLERKLVRKMDAFLRRYMHIYEFSHDENCLFRLSISTSDADLTLSDDVHICRGELLGELHFWNEHIPQIPPEGPDLAWALAFQRRLAHSLEQVAAYVQTDPMFQHIRAFRGEESFASPYNVAHTVAMAEHWGFDVVSRENSAGVWQGIVDFWANLYAMSLIWAFNPGGLKGNDLHGLRREQLWISTDTLIRKYGTEKRNRMRAERRVERERQLVGSDVYDLERQTASTRL